MMTEQEWLKGDGTQAMLELVRGVVSERKLRLFACACTQIVRDLLWTKEYGLRALTCAEDFADGVTTRDELAAAQAGVESRLELYAGEPVYDASYWACSANIAEDAEWCAVYAANVSMKPLDHADSASAFQVRAEMVRTQTDYLRDIIGPVPFRTVSFLPSWRTETMTSLAEGIYADRAFDRLPILADALQDAGCEDEDILGHCRGDGPHVRGCWVVDLVLGKE